MRAPSLLLACLLGFAAAGGVAIIDNRAEAAVLLSAAVRVPEGDYLVESVGNDDKTLRNDNNSGRSLYPSANGNGITFRQLSDDMTLIEGDAGKCLSQQWCGKEDCIGVLYDCVFGPNRKNNGLGLRPAKQQWLLVPAKGIAGVLSAKSSKKPSSSSKKSSSKKSSSKKTKSKSKSKSKSSKSSKGKRSKPKPGYRCSQPAFRREHPRGCAKHQKRAEIATASSLGLEKRASSYGPFFIIAYDHLLDMSTRALTNKVGDAAGASTQLGTQLVEWDQSDRAQMWTLRRA